MKSLKFTVYMVVAMLATLLFIVAFGSVLVTAFAAIQYLMGGRVEMLTSSPITPEFLFAVPLLAFLVMWACVSAIFKALDWSMP